MRAREFVSEGLSIKPSGKMRHDHSQAQKGVHLARDIGGYDRIYHMNRLMMALACSDGKSKKPPKDVDGSSWYEKYNTIHPYTEVEHNMVHQAMGVVPTDGAEIVSDHRSLESDDTHKTSPVQAFKGYAR
jgi:hypothetical protein